MAKLVERFALSKANASDLNTVRKLNLWFVFYIYFVNICSWLLRTLIV